MENGFAYLPLRTHTSAIKPKVFLFQSTIPLAVSCGSPSTTLEVFLFYSITTLAVPCASPPFHHTDSISLPVLLTIPFTDSHALES